jgi:excisionase family DNA binding protein
VYSDSRRSLVPSDEIMTLQQVAKYLQMGTGKLYHLAQIGEILAAKIGRTWRFRKDLVDAWFAEAAAEKARPKKAAAGGNHKNEF